MTISAHWKDEAGIFTPLELQVIALAAGSPGECGTCGPADGRMARLGRRIGKAFALHVPTPLANARLEALRQLACRSFARSGTIGEPCAEAALAAGLSERHIETLGRLAAGWRRGR